MTAPQVRKMPAEEARAFLSAVWPDGAPGHLAVTRFQNRTPATSWFAGGDLDALARHAAAESAHGDVYVGCCSHATVANEGRGSEASVLAVPGIWVDLDVLHPDAHKSKSLPPTIGDALELLDGLPRPSLIVSSGFGLHVWWLYREPWTIESEPDRAAAKTVGQRVQAFLRERAKRRGWTVDNTADLARILRIPGTRNHKTADRPMAVIVDEDPARYNPSDFDVLPDLFQNSGNPPEDQNSGHRGAAGPTDWGPAEGQYRHDWLRGKAVVLASAGVPVAGIAPALRAWADALPGERKTDAELRNLAESAVAKFGRPAAEPEPLPALAPLDLSATHDEAIPWLLPDYLARGEAAILAGHAGAGKSIVALDLALAAATGTPFLGRELVGAPLRVVYVDEEQPVATVRRRVGRLLRGRGLTVADLGDRLAYFHQPGLDLSRPEHVELIVAAVREHRADLVIFDSLVRFLGRLNARDESDVATFFRGLAPLTRDLGAAVLWLHHRKKPQTGEAEGEQQFSVRGSTDLPAAVSEVLVLDKLPAGGRTLHHAKCRPAEEQPPLGVELQDDEAAGALRVVATGCAADAEATVVNALTEAGRAGVLRSAIVTALEDAGSRDADRLTTKTLGRLHARGRAAKRQEGRSVRYWKSEFAPADVRDAEAVLRGD